MNLIFCRKTDMIKCKANLFQETGAESSGHLERSLDAVLGDRGRIIRMLIPYSANLLH
jgi:hypothetical protein